MQYTAPTTLFLILILNFCLSSCSGNDSFDPDDLSFLNVPDGFQIEAYLKNIENPRGLCKSPDGTVFVGSRDAGKVYAIKDTNGDFRADKKWILAEGLNMPVGVAFKDGDLYFSEIGKIWVIRDVLSKLGQEIEPKLHTDIYPPNESHGWKYIAFGPDGNLYVPVGAPCNNCISEDSVFASITRLESKSDYEVIAHGVRNTVGFDWHPVTGDLWFTDNGRDWLGDNSPPCELNHLENEGQHFGFPYCHGTSVSDPEFGDQADCADFTSPVQDLGPHVAPLGMKFYRGDQFPTQYKHQVFIAEHGSWNRSTKIGYRITLVRLNENYESEGYETFIDGWEKDGEVLGRPVDLLELNDGSFLISDDYSDIIYRLSYGK